MEIALDRTDRLALESAEHMSHEKVFGDLRKKVNGQ